MITAPLGMLIAIRALLAEAGAAGGATAADPGCRGRGRSRRGAGRVALGGCWRSSSSAAPPTRASSSCATRRSGRPDTAPSSRVHAEVHGKPVLYAGQDRFAAYELLGADTARAAGRVPRRRRAREPDEAVRHRRRLQPDRLRLVHPRRRSNHFNYVVTSRGGLEQPGAARTSSEVAGTDSYVLWKRTGPRPRTASRCSRAPSRRRRPTAPRPRSASSLAHRGRAALFPRRR